VEGVPVRHRRGSSRERFAPDRGAPAMAMSWRRGAVVNTDTTDTIADGVAGRYPIPEVLEDLLEVIDDVVLVDDESIKTGMRHLFNLAGLVVEPSAALGVAALSRRSRSIPGADDRDSHLREQRPAQRLPPLGALTCPTRASTSTAPSTGESRYSQMMNGAFAVGAREWFTSAVAGRRGGRARRFATVAGVARRAST
jgi:hypothetical protein